MSGHRNIAAPFQIRQQIDPSTALAELPAQTLGPRDYIDYTNSTFTPLEPVPTLTLEKYCGPTPESNWVIPDRLLVGAYPASQSDVETFELLISILKLKISTFVCLQQEYRTHGITEAMWRSGHALRPYFEDVKLIIKNKAMFKSLSEHPGIVDSQNLDFVHFPIRDCGISDDAAVLKLSQSLVARLDKGERLYLHCWGGHGRTGTVVCIVLHLMYGMAAEDAFAYCQRAHDLRQCPVNVGSPQTETQRDQVRRVVAALIQHRKNQALQLSSSPKVQYPPIESSVVVRQVVVRENSTKGIRSIIQDTDGIAIVEGNPQPATVSVRNNNIAARTAGLTMAVDTAAGAVPMMASPPSTPPASSSGKRGGRNVTYTVSADQAMVLKQPSPPGQQIQAEGPLVVHVASAGIGDTSASLPLVRHTGSASGSRPTSPSPLVTQRSTQKLELHPHVVNLPMEPLPSDSPVAHEQELLKSIPPDLVQGKAVIPHVGLYPMVRMPTERLKNDLNYGATSPPNSRDGRRRGSRSVVPNLSTVSDAMELSENGHVSNRRMSAGTIMAHTIIMNATQDSSPNFTAHVPVVTPPLDQKSKSVTEDKAQLARVDSSTSDGHTSNSAASVSASDEDAHADFGDTSAFIKGTSGQSLVAEETSAVDDTAMDIDTESAVRPASPSVAAQVKVLSSGASTFMGFHRR